ncbi:MAG TPA: hypothetical protein VIL34_07805 [Actinopolymorphaceae bacterium]|jgi:hypothetical protein
MWPAISNFAHDYTYRYEEERARYQPIRFPRQRNNSGKQLVVRSLRGTGAGLVRLADRLEAPRTKTEAC